MLRIGVLASHEGTTLQSIIDACVEGRVNGRVVVVISNNSGSGALRRAAAAGIDTLHVSSVTHPSRDALDAAICDALRRARADVIFLAGYMKRLDSRTLAAFPRRILNTHPALLPKFEGRECSEIARSKRSLPRVSPGPVRWCTSWMPSTTPGPLCVRSVSASFPGTRRVP